MSVLIVRLKHIGIAPLLLFTMISEQFVQDKSNPNESRREADKDEP